jgi:lipopolysaccharide transport system ATP-binding protein
MSDIVIKAENLGKAYQLGEFSTGTISQDIERWFAKMRGKEDRFARIGETNDRAVKGKSDFVWSLKELNFEIKKGDAVGVIGKNGAGKSTLLKILSRVTTPTTGIVSVKGRIASLLEVGTGFHPELTGRENIFLNGAMLGMRKENIRKHFDAIVDFAGVERYIDTPVKRYSSGMYVRLAFAVAAHLDSEILIVDEVLAVGDADFQKKCLGKMNEVSKGEGRTILFVSHNLSSIKNLCNTGILLENGCFIDSGPITSVVQAYNNRSHGARGSTTAYSMTRESLKPFFREVTLSAPDRDGDEEFSSASDLLINILVENYSYQKNLAVTILIRNKDGDVIIHSTDEVSSVSGSAQRRCMIPAELLSADTYFVTLAVGSRLGELYEKLEDVLTFTTVYDGRLKDKNYVWKGLLSPEVIKWDL